MNKEEREILHTLQNTREKFRFGIGCLGKCCNFNNVILSILIGSTRPTQAFSQELIQYSLANPVKTGPTPVWFIKSPD